MVRVILASCAYFMRKNIINKKGVALIVVVMLIVFVSIAVLGVTTFIVQWFSQLNNDQINAKCLYLAQAGIQDAIYKVRSTYLNPPATYGSYTTGLTTVNTGETYRRGGTAADFLMVNTVGATWSSSNNTLSGIRLQKATGSATPAVTIASMNICWTKSSAATRNVNRITIGTTNYTVNVAPSACPGGLANITDRTLTNVSFLAFALRWSGSITLTDVLVKFNMTDGSSKTVDLWPSINSCQFTINSTGKVASYNIYRTIKATYDLMPATYSTTSRITDIDEINTEIVSP